MLVESKADLKKRGLRSADLANASSLPSHVVRGAKSSDTAVQCAIPQLGLLWVSCLALVRQQSNESLPRHCPILAPLCWRVCRAAVATICWATICRADISSNFVWRRLNLSIGAVQHVFTRSTAPHLKADYIELRVLAMRHPYTGTSILGT
jgi:hypothetical protein